MRIETVVAETAVVILDKHMKFFDRKEEIATLRKIRNNAENNAQFTVLTGRRRIGKTSLVLKAYEDKPFLYFFVGRKAESLLCEEFRNEVEEKLGVKLGGTPSGFAELFDYLMQLSKQQSFTLFIDEFQNFVRQFSAIYRKFGISIIQNHESTLLYAALSIQ